MKNEFRTEQIEVCSECQKDIRKYEKQWHYFTCPRCLETCCANFKPRFEVVVREITPHPLSDSMPYYSESIERLDEFEWRGNYCLECSAHVRRVLTAAGLLKTKTESQELVATLD